MTQPGPDTRPLAPEPRERLAALDVGSNSIRLLVAEYDPVAGLSVIDEVKDQPRLAQGLVTTGRLDDAAMERAMVALRRMRDVCQRRGVRRLSAVATAAMREASNGGEFVGRVRDELGIPLRIIDAETEAALSYRSVAHHFRLDDSRTLVADIGGGSLELIGAVSGIVELTRVTPPRRGAAHRAVPGQRPRWTAGGAEAPEPDPEDAPARRGRPRVGRDARDRIRRHLHQPGPHGDDPARRAPGGDGARAHHHDRGSRAPARVAGDEDAGAAPGGARPQPRSGPTSSWPASRCAPSCWRSRARARSR